MKKDQEQEIREIIAKNCFDGRPHNLIFTMPDKTKLKVTPNWNEQPEHIKAVFYKEADGIINDFFMLYLK